MSDLTGIAELPAPPYYAVIFTSRRAPGDHGYDAMAQAMVKLGSAQPGFLGIESVRGADGLGITVSYWRERESIRAWKAEAEHQKAQRGGKQSWYEHSEVRIACVERTYGGPEGRARRPDEPAAR